MSRLNEILDRREFGYRETPDELIKPSFIELLPEQALPQTPAEIEQTIIDWCEEM